MTENGKDDAQTAECANESPDTDEVVGRRSGGLISIAKEVTDRAWETCKAFSNDSFGLYEQIWPWRHC